VTRTVSMTDSSIEGRCFDSIELMPFTGETINEAEAIPAPGP
jgi:hypothetical protein